MLYCDLEGLYCDLLYLDLGLGMGMYAWIRSNPHHAPAVPYVGSGWGDVIKVKGWG